MRIARCICVRVLSGRVTDRLLSSVGVQVLAWPGTRLFVRAVRTGHSGCWAAPSRFRWQPSARCSTVSARYVRPSRLRCRWTNDMELVPKQFAWAGHANWLFLSYSEDVSFRSVLGTLSTLEALFATMRYINWHLHYIILVPEFCQAILELFVHGGFRLC